MFVIVSLMKLNAVIMQIPFCVVVGWIMGKPMDLNFQLFETATLFITVLVVAFMLQVCSKIPFFWFTENSTKPFCLVFLLFCPCVCELCNN